MNGWYLPTLFSLKQTNKQNSSSLGTFLESVQCSWLFWLLPFLCLVIGSFYFSVAQAMLNFSNKTQLNSPDMSCLTWRTLHRWLRAAPPCWCLWLWGQILNSPIPQSPKGKLQTPISPAAAFQFSLVLLNWEAPNMVFYSNLFSVVFSLLTATTCFRSWWCWW